MERQNPEFNPNFEKDLEQTPLLKKTAEWGPEFDSLLQTSWESESSNSNKEVLKLANFQEVANFLQPGEMYVFTGKEDLVLDADLVEIPGVVGLHGLVNEGQLVGLSKDSEGDIQ